MIVAPLHGLHTSQGRTFTHRLALDGDENLHVRDFVTVTDDQHAPVEATVERMASDGYMLLQTAIS